MRTKFSMCRKEGCGAPSSRRGFFFSPFSFLHAHALLFHESFQIDAVHVLRFLVTCYKVHSSTPTAGSDLLQPLLAADPALDHRLVSQPLDFTIGSRSSFEYMKSGCCVCVGVNIRNVCACRTFSASEAFLYRCFGLGNCPS